jgi:hypothetical protein
MHGVRGGRDAQQRAVDIDEERQTIGVCERPGHSLFHVFVLSHDINQSCE